MKISVRAAIYFVFCTIISTTRFWGTNVGNSVRYILAALMTLYIIACLCDNRNSFVSLRKGIIVNHVHYIVKPYLVFAIYTLVIWLFNDNVFFRNYTRLASTILYLILAWGFVCYGFYLFGKKALDYTFWAGVVSYILGSVLPLAFYYGPIYVWRYFAGSLVGKELAGSYYMEVHDLTFAMGFYFLYYLFFENKSEKLHKTKVVIALFMIVFGLKKIEILALVLSMAIYLLMMRKGKSTTFKSVIFFVGFTVGAFAYIYLTKSGLLDALTVKLGLDAKNRIGYYSYAAKYFEITPFYFGQGYTYFSRLWAQLYLEHFRIDGYAIAAALHSDILVMYIEVGFLPFIWWIYYSFVKKVKLIKRNYGNVVSECALLLTIYLFTLYLTDNTSTYFITQMAYLLVLLSASENRNQIEMNYIEENS